jgi:NADH:ubiquinone oxidoreductase subunit 5 (subunit L)/multisubunit Na+/H+ antiporter MnhA subunit
VVTAPLVLLAIPSVVIGFLTMEPLLFGDFLKSAIFVDAAKHPAMAELAHRTSTVPLRWRCMASTLHRSGWLWLV